MLLLIQYFGVYKFKVLLYYAKNVVKHEIDIFVKY